MKNVVVGNFAAGDLRAQVEKLLRGLGNPEPPLDLRAVRELLRLDLQFYSTTDDGPVREFVSRVRVAGKQIIARPTLLIDVIRKARLSALWVPDRSRILIDATTPKLKQRWYEAHEVGHGLAPWHGDFLYGDPEETLSPMCQEELEAEANYTAGQLLFMADRFTTEASDVVASLSSVRKLAKRYGNTITTTLWRFIEEAHHNRPMVGMVSPNPFADHDGAFDSHQHRRYCIESPQFKARFSSVSDQHLLAMVDGYISFRRGGPIGEAERVLPDDNGQEQLFHFETFSNRYSFLTLGIHIRPLTSIVAVRYPVNSK